MTAEELERKIEAEIAGRWAESNAHGCDLRRCLVPPRKLKFRDGNLGSGEVLQLWLVLEERPETADGYKIVYDERSGSFGLAVPAEGSNVAGDPNLDVYIGPHGSFWTTFEGM